MSEIEQSDFANANTVLAARLARNSDLIGKITSTIASLGALTSKEATAPDTGKMPYGHLSLLTGLSYSLGENNESLAYILDNLKRMVN